jgi:hypothetical protein
LSLARGTHLSPLSGLTVLKRLELSGTDLSPLSELTGLKELYSVQIIWF